MTIEAILIGILIIAVLGLYRNNNRLEAQITETNQHLENLVEIAKQIQHHTEQSSSILYSQTPEARQFADEIDRLQP
jgi:hypothetical protein